MNIRIASTVLPLLLLALGAAGCDRRDAQPIEPSDTADTVVDDTPDVATSDAATSDTATAGSAPPIQDTCAGLTGTAEADCRARNNDGLPPTPPPVNPEEETEDAPPTP